jgi:peptidoglycan/LPS O-acetylase OafA/YrhL
MCLIILIFSFQQGKLSRLLSHRLLVSMGEISFAFYLVHMLVIQYVEWLNYRLHLTDNLFVLSAFMLAVSLALSTVLHRYIERPCHAWIKARWLHQMQISKANRMEKPYKQPVMEFA